MLELTPLTTGIRPTNPFMAVDGIDVCTPCTCTWKNRTEKLQTHSKNKSDFFSAAFSLEWRQTGHDRNESYPKIILMDAWPRNMQDSISFTLYSFVKFGFGEDRIWRLSQIKSGLLNEREENLAAIFEKSLSLLPPRIGKTRNGTLSSSSERTSEWIYVVDDVDDDNTQFGL